MTTWFTYMTSVYSLTITKGVNGIIFCSFMELTAWNSNLCEIWETEEVEYDLDPETTKGVQKRVFTVAQVSLKFIRAKWNYNFHHWTNNIFHTNMCEIGVHFWHNDLKAGRNMARMDYKRGGSVPSTLPGGTYMTDDINCVRLRIYSIQTKKGTTTSLWCFSRYRNWFFAFRHWCTRFKGQAILSSIRSKGIILQPVQACCSQFIVRVLCLAPTLQEVWTTTTRQCRPSKGFKRKCRHRWDQGHRSLIASCIRCYPI